MIRVLSIILPAYLENDDGWENTVEGCQYILHVASPFPSRPPKNENDLILPARDGAIRILKLASAANVKRVVLTSSLAAVVSGHDYDESKIFDESDWSRTDRNIGSYEKSKTLAEQGAWDFMKGLESDKALELSVINPGLVLGPILDPEKAFYESGLQDSDQQIAEYNYPFFSTVRQISPSGSKGSRQAR